MNLFTDGIFIVGLGSLVLGPKKAVGLLREAQQLYREATGRLNELGEQLQREIEEGGEHVADPQTAAATPPVPEILGE